MQVQQEITKHSTANDERFYTVPNAARASGIPKHKLRREIKLKLIPSYGLMDGRQYVRLSDINAAMGFTAFAQAEAMQNGGVK